MQNNKELKGWEKTHPITLSVYEVATSFSKEEIYGITSQLSQPAFSIPANITEYCSKNTKGELGYFLTITQGSVNESEYFLIVPRDLKYVLQKGLNSLFVIMNAIKAMLIFLTNKISKTNSKSRT